MESQINMQELMENELANRFNRPWTKLDPGSKTNRLCLYIKKIKIEKELDDESELKFKTLLVRVLTAGGLNKISEIEYSPDTAEIIKIKNLIYCEETKSFSFQTKKKKKTETSKSKSNIDRHFNKSKEKTN